MCNKVVNDVRCEMRRAPVQVYSNSCPEREHVHAPLHRRRSHQSDAPFTTAALQVLVASVVLDGWIFISTLKRHEQPNNHLYFVLSTLDCAAHLRFGTIIAKLNEMANGNFTRGAAWRNLEPNSFCSYEVPRRARGKSALEQCPELLPSQPPRRLDRCHKTKSCS